MTDEHRKLRLRYLIATDYEGSQEKFGKQSERGKGRISQLVGESEPFGELAAKKLAKDLELPKLWFSSTWLTPKEAAALGCGMDALEVVNVQTELGDIYIPEATRHSPLPELTEPMEFLTNQGIEFFKVKSPDMLGSDQWSVVRNNRTIKVDILHRTWLDAYHKRECSIVPGDSLKCKFEERIGYDDLGNEVSRTVAVIEVLSVISPPVQTLLQY